MKAIITCLFVLTIQAFALTAKEILEIAEKPHNRDNLVEALKIYPEARKYKVIQKSGPNQNDLHEAPEIVALEKTVEGKYIVTETNLGETEDGKAVRFIMVVYYDPEMNVLRKWILGYDDAVGSMTGIPDLETRTIAWVSDAQGGTRELSHETQGDKRVTWRSVIMNDGKIEVLVQGVAVKVE